MARPTSEALRDIVRSTHTARGRVTVLNPYTTTPWQQSLTPVGGTVVQVLDGDVRMDSSAVIRSTIDVTVAARWRFILPNGTELFVEYGVEVAGGQFEWVSLGYFRVDDVFEDGPGRVRVVGSDRMAQAVDTDSIFPWVAPATTTHQDFLSSVLYGRSPAGWFHGNAGIFSSNAASREIVADYNLAGRTIGQQVPLDKSYAEHLVDFGSRFDKRLFFDYRGRLTVVSDAVKVAPTPVRTIAAGRGGTLRNLRRRVTRDGAWTSTSTRGEAPTDGPTGIGWRIWGEVRPPTQTTYPDGLSWFGPFGRVARKYSSPLLVSGTELDAAAWTWLQKSRGLGYSLAFSLPADPTLETLDTVAVTFPIQAESVQYPPAPVLATGTVTTELHVLDTLTLPLTGGDMAVTTRGAILNAVTGEVIV